jgi:serine/threonine protein kinase
VISPSCTPPDKKWGCARESKLFDPNFSMADYEMVRKLGAGTYGKVKLIRHKATGKQYAAKFMPTMTSGSREVSPSVLHELEIREMDDPNVIGTCKLALEKTAKGNTSFVMFMDVAATSVRGILDKYPPPGPFEMQTTALQIVRSEAVSEARLVLSLDNKPDNLLAVGTDVLARDSEPSLGNFTLIKQTDYGISNGFFYKQSNSTPQFSPWYRPPEVLLGMPYSATHAGPAWACACIIYEIATDAVLFPGYDEKDQIFKIVGLLGAPPVDMRNDWYPDWQKGYPEFAPDTTEFRKKLSGHPLLADMLLRMLDYDLTMRYTVFDALKHPYFSREAKKKVKTALGLKKLLPDWPDWYPSATMPRLDPPWVMDVLDSKLASCASAGLCRSHKPWKESAACAAKMLDFAILGYPTLEVAHLGLAI